MKALLMWANNLIRVEDVDKPQPQIKIPIRKVFNVAYRLEPKLAATHGSNFIAFVFRYVDGGRHYLVYELEGFDNLPQDKPQSPDTTGGKD